MTTHNAPPVVYPLGRSRFQAVVLTGLWLAGLLAVLFWLNVGRSIDWRAFLAAVVLLFAGLAAFKGWINSPNGQLMWDGQLWRWESLGYQTSVAEQTLFVIADFQNLLLIRLENQAHASLWLWAERKASPERWLDLRCAVYAPHRATDGSRASGFKHAQTADAAHTQP